MKYLAVCFVGMVIAGCSFFGENANCEDSLFDAMRVTLQNSMQFVQESCSSGLNPTYRAVMTISPDDLESLQNSTPIREWSTDASEASVFDEEAAKLSSLLIGRHGDGAYLTEVLIDTANPDQYTVYYYRSFID